MLRFTLKRKECWFPVTVIKMSKSFLIKIIAPILLNCIFSIVLFGQSVGSLPYKSQEVSDKDGIPVLIKHLPEWESVRNRTTFARSVGNLKPALGDRPLLDLIDFSAGTEAVTAQYDAGKLLIVEFGTPQGSIDADSLITRSLAESGDTTTTYRRIGNYNVLVFDAPDLTAAANLLDQVKYEKNIQWLGDNPFRISAERVFILTTSDIFLSTVLVIVMGIGFAILTGTIVGFTYFQLRERRRAAMSTFTDAGGMTRLNLDGFTPDIVPERLLGD
ncbi:MAG: LapA family protein [Pyrinomonadaceae bacterium]